MPGDKGKKSARDGKKNRRRVNHTYLLRARTPMVWFEQAQGQRIVARLVLNRLLELMKAQHERGDRNRVEQLACMQTYMLLQGLAFENTAKGILVSRKSSVVTEEKLSPPPDVHQQLSAVISQLLGRTSAAENKLLARVQEYLVWAGKYPVHKVAEECETASKKGHRVLSFSDVELADRIFGRLDACIAEQPHRASSASSPRATKKRSELQSLDPWNRFVTAANATVAQFRAMQETDEDLLHLRGLAEKAATLANELPQADKQRALRIIKVFLAAERETLDTCSVPASDLGDWVTERNREAVSKQASRPISITSPRNRQET
jgi:hypothetical protein